MQNNNIDFETRAFVLINHSYEPESRLKIKESSL